MLICSCHCALHSELASLAVMCLIFYVFVLIFSGQALFLQGLVLVTCILRLRIGFHKG